MDDEAIFEGQRAALLRVVVAAFAVAGLVPGGPSPSAFSGAIRRRLLRMLAPAESALRRLIEFRARGIVATAGKKRAAPSKPIPRGHGGRDRIPPFALFDPRKWFAELAKSRRRRSGPGPRISSFDEPRAPAGPVPEQPDAAAVDPARLCRRLQALLKALNDIPAQAKRLARMKARRRADSKVSTPLRPGPPPGFRPDGPEDIDDILFNCDWLVRKKPQPEPPDKRP